MNETWVRRMPENFGDLQWKDVTNIHPVGLIAVLVLGILMLMVSRRRAVLPMVVVACFIPAVQKVVVFSLDFNLLRIMVLFGVLRLLIRGEGRGFHWKTIDKVLVTYVISAALINTLQIGTLSAFINRLGFAFDALGMYFVFRCLIRSWEDVDHLILGCIMISIPLAFAFGVEYATRRNLFSVFGGVPEITMIRDGALRCQGAFSHPILAGCFWATWVPLFASRWWKNAPGRLWAIVGIGACLFIIFACHSSTPVFGVIAALVGGLAFYWRYRMREVLWGIVLSLAALHIIMKRPVWGLLAIASSVGGGTGWHRYKLIDSAIRRIGEWWLLGTRSTAHWGWGMQDVTNQYILEGVRGGLLTLALFVAVIVLAFRGVGHLWRASRHDPHRLALSWAMGISLFVHCMNFIGVSYFGQIHIAWYLVLGMIGSSIPIVTPVHGHMKTVAAGSRTKEL